MIGRKHKIQKKLILLQRITYFSEIINLLFGRIKLHFDAFIQKKCIHRDIDIQKHRKRTIERGREWVREREKDGERVKEKKERERLLLYYCIVEWISMYPYKYNS